MDSNWEDSRVFPSDPPLDRFHLLIPERLPDMYRRIIAVRKDPLAVLPVSKRSIEEDDGAAMPAAKPEVAFIPRRLLEPSQVGLADLHGGPAASANDLLRPVGSDGNDLHAHDS